MRRIAEIRIENLKYRLRTGEIKTEEFIEMVDELNELEQFSLRVVNKWGQQ